LEITMSFLPKFSSADDFWPLAARPADPATALLGVLAASARRAGTGARATVAQIIVWRLHRRASQELSRLDGRMLRDMGLARDEIARAVYCRNSAVAIRQRTSAEMFPR
jgi:uncharacterized protein YjiS (DUF1127 family)